MSDRADVIYVYDGTFDGLMCCVFESYTQKEIPVGIFPHEPEQLSFTDVKYIETVAEHAERIIRSIPVKMSGEIFDFIRKGFLTCAENKELLILRFMYLGYKYGAKVMTMLADNTVNELFKAVQHCSNEAHLLLGFVRFTETGSALAAVITPKNSVIPIIAGHFIDRFRNENFIIYDKTHRMALVYFSRKAEILENIDFRLPEVTDTEESYRKLWKAFYDAIGIKERFNPRCRMTHMPKRYWENMIEVSDELETGAGRELGYSDRERLGAVNSHALPTDKCSQSNFTS